ncbi:MAG: hypothetical protein OHK93_005272 [Ramalina farinacea]|uniref:Ankyrin repeat protein n=1 Tax=Ramalina farinacea TaxID=258253 RepID=A0AA43QW33_9LECA|nr:hypothetical protein [Ramalina farinacea]
MAHDSSTSSSSSSSSSSSQHDRYPTSAGHRRQRSILQACASGNILRLKHLFNQIGVRAGDQPVEPQWLPHHRKIVPVPASGPPPTSAMIYQVVRHAQASTLALLLATYPHAQVADALVLATAFAHPDFPTFKLLYEHDPTIARFDGFPHYTTSLMQACRRGGGDPLIPAFLLDHHADPAATAGPHHEDSALAAAIEHDQPLWLIEKTVRAGGVVDSSALLAAIRAQRFQVLAWLVERCWIEDRARVLAQALLAARKMERFGMVGLLEGQLRCSPPARRRRPRMMRRWGSGGFGFGSDGCGSSESSSSRSSDGTGARVDRIPFGDESPGW